MLALREIALKKDRVIVQNIGIKQKHVIFMTSIVRFLHEKNMKNNENNKKHEGENNENHILSVKT